MKSLIVGLLSAKCDHHHQQKVDTGILFFSKKIPPLKSDENIIKCSNTVFFKNHEIFKKGYFESPKAQ